MIERSKRRRLISCNLLGAVFAASIESVCGALVTEHLAGSSELVGRSGGLLRVIYIGSLLPRVSQIERRGIHPTRIGATVSGDRRLVGNGVLCTEVLRTSCILLRMRSLVSCIGEVKRRGIPATRI